MNPFASCRGNAGGANQRYHSPMRRWLALLLICLLPLQASWAAVASYCLHGQGEAPTHFGHHAEEHQVSAESVDHDGQSDPLGQGHQHDHLSGFLALTSKTLTIPFPSSPTTWSGDERIYPSLPPDQPDRPNWRFPV